MGNPTHEHHDFVYTVRCKHVRANGTDCTAGETYTAPVAYRTAKAAKRHLHEVIEDYAAYVSNMGITECHPPFAFKDGCGACFVQCNNGHLIAEVVAYAVED